MLKPCLVCGSLSHEPRCPTHRVNRPSSTARGYDSRWRRRAKAQVRAVPLCECQGCGIHAGQCGSQSDLTADHIHPLARGGSADDVLQTLCRPCNSSKKDRMPHG